MDMALAVKPQGQKSSLLYPIKKSKTAPNSSKSSPRHSEDGLPRVVVSRSLPSVVFHVHRLPRGRDKIKDSSVLSSSRGTSSTSSGPDTIRTLITDRAHRMRKTLDLMNTRKVHKRIYGSNKQRISGLHNDSTDVSNESVNNVRMRESMTSSTSPSRERTQALSRSTRMSHRSVDQKPQKSGYLRQFKRLGKFVVILISLWKKHAQRVREFLENSVQMVDYGPNTDLLFDVTEYKAGRQARVSRDTVRILKKKPMNRTEEDVKYVALALQTYKTIAEFPVHIQNMIARKSWYEKYVGRRVIIRQGHVARCFYFILSGSVIVTQMDRNCTISRTVNYLHRGDSFGELGVLYNGKRSASVISEGTVELFVVSDEDYIDIFSSGGLKDTNDPFLKSVSCLQGWPTPLLASNTPQKAVIRFFKRGTVIVNDSHKNPWIYIIKSGSVSVLKKLWQKQDEPDYLGFSEKALLEKSGSEHERFLDGCIHYMDSVRKKTDIVTHQRQLRDLIHVPLQGDDLISALTPDKADASVATPCESSHSDYEEDDEMEACTAAHKKRVSHVTSLMKSLGKSYFSKITYGSEAGETIKSVKEPKPLFVQIQTLSRGDVFGLSELLHKGQPSVSLVSNGAECVLIDSKFFMQKCPQSLLRKLLHEVSPYPSDEELQRSLERHLQWDQYKSEVFKDSLSYSKIKQNK